MVAEENSEEVTEELELPEPSTLGLGIMTDTFQFPEDAARLRNPLREPDEEDSEAEDTSISVLPEGLGKAKNAQELGM